MPSRIRRHLFGPLTTLTLPFAALFVLGVSPVTAQDPDPQEEEEEQENPWQEGLPLEPTRVLEFTTSEGSWMSVDISPDGQTLVFDLLGDLYTMPASGGTATPLTQGMAVDGQPRFSPDGSQVVFTSDRSGGEGVWIISVDKSDTTQVTTGKDTKYDSPEWTPDGEYIVVTRGTKLHMYHVDGGSGQQLIEEPGNLRTMGAAFGENETEIWFGQRTGSWQYNTDLPDYQLAVYDRETGETSTRTSNVGSAFRPTLSPDGRWLVYGTRFDQQTGLRIRDLEDGSERWLAYPVQRDDQESRATLDAYPGMTFTPDSDALIAYYGGGLWRIDIESGEQASIPFTANVVQHMAPRVWFDYPIEDTPTFVVKQINEPAASPSADRVAFVAMDRLWVMTYPDGEPQRIDDREIVQMNPSWSPDGSSIVYATWSDADGGQIWRVSADGGTPTQLTSDPALYTNPVWAPNDRIVYQRAPMDSWVAGENRGPSSFWWLPATGGDPTYIAETEGRGNVHFVEGDERIWMWAGSGMRTIRWDGTDERIHFDVDGASFATMNPTGEREALAINGRDAYIVTIPLARSGDGSPIEVSTSDNDFPAVRLTDDLGGQDIAWFGGDRAVSWGIGNALVVYDRDDAQAFADSVEAAEEAAEDEPDEPEEEEEEADEEDEDDDGYSPIETRVQIEMERDIPQGVAALVGARLITMNGDEVIENGTIIVRNNRIEAVGPTGQVGIPAGANEIDVSGHTIVPGFVDTHAHLRARGVHRVQNWSYVANLAYGVTTTRDPQTGTTDVLDYEDQVRAGNVLGPRIYSTGPGVFSGENIRDLDHARDVLSRYSEYYDTKTIKQYVAGNREQRQWIIQAAMEQELMPTTEGSLDAEMGISEAIDGYSGHEHSWPQFPFYSDLIRFYAYSGIAYTPTILVTYGGPWAENYFYATYDPHSDEKLHAFTPHSEIDDKALRRSDGWFLPEEHSFGLISDQIDQLLDAGGVAGVGSHGQLQGLGYHWELWATAGVDKPGQMDAHRALRIATIMGADALGLDNDLGSIETGKLADLAILSANPLDDIRNTNTVQMVMINGRLFDANTLAEIHPTAGPAPTFYWQGTDPDDVRAGIGR
jgi:Tol biopolymer transport system component